MVGHDLPSGLPPRLDVRIPPREARRALGYEPLLALLDDLGKKLDRNAADISYLRQWEARAMRHLDPTEKDLLMRVSPEAEFDLSLLPEERWKSLRAILLRRKGLSAS